MRAPIWKGKPEHQVQQAAVMFHQMRAGALANAQRCLGIADDAEVNLHRIGYGLDLVLRQLDSGDPAMLAIEIDV